MKRLITIAALTFSLACGSAVAAPSNLATPELYDNVENGGPWGQTFLAEDPLVLGVRWFIGDPLRLSDSRVNELIGTANLVLFDVADISNPLELARTQVQDAGGSTFGLSTFLFAAAVPTTVGSSYFIAIEADDAFGLGLRSLSSTYEGGGEAFFDAGTFMSIDRDTSFDVLSAVPIAPSAVLLISGIAALFSRVHKHRSPVAKC